MMVMQFRLQAQFKWPFALPKKFRIDLALSGKPSQMASTAMLVQSSVHAGETAVDFSQRAAAREQSPSPDAQD